MSREVFICDTVHTPIDRSGGSLPAMCADDLAAVSLKALVERNPGVDWSALDEVFLGYANRAGEDDRNVARMALLLVGLPESVPGVALNRLCALRMDVIGTAFHTIVCGEMELVVTGGAESVPRAPYMMDKADSIFGCGQKIEDATIGWRSVNLPMKEQHSIDPVPQTADDVADDYRMSRTDQDTFALRSQQRADEAQTVGFFAEGIIPATIRGRKGDTPVEYDEHPRPGTALEALVRLKPVNGLEKIVTAGNAFGVNDGAAVLALVSIETVGKYGLTPRARVLGMASAGIAPRTMGAGLVPAVRKLLRRLGLAIDAFDVIELNEASVNQGLVYPCELGVVGNSEKVNPNGGATAPGHPPGINDARLVLIALHQLEKSGGRRSLAIMCVGVGQDLALAIERVRLAQPGRPPGIKSACRAMLSMARRRHGVCAAEQDVPSHGQDEADPVERTTA